MEGLDKELKGFIESRPTFSPEMAKHIEEETRRMVEEARKWHSEHKGDIGEQLSGN